MRIALFSTSWFDFYVVELARALARRHEVMVVLDQHDTLFDDLTGPSITHVRVPWFASRRYPLRNINAIRTIAGRLSQFRPDVVHFQEHDPRISFLMPFLSRVPIVMDLHNVYPLAGMEAPVRDRLRDITRSRINAIVVHGRAMKNAVHARYGDSAPEVFEMPFGAFTSLGTSTANGENGHPPVGLFFGRIAAYKGLETLIAAAPHAARTYSDPFRIHIAGAGHLGPYLPVDENVFMITNERVKDPARLFRSADFIVQPYSSGSASGVTPVAYAHEKPVIVTEVGSLAETVQDGITGFVVPPKDPRALGDAIAKLLGDPALRRSMGKAGRRLIDGELSWDRNIHRVEAAYVAALSSREKRIPA